MDVLYWIQNSDCLTKHIIYIPSLSKLEREVFGHVLSNGVSISDRNPQAPGMVEAFLHAS